MFIVRVLLLLFIFLKNLYVLFYLIFIQLMLIIYFLFLPSIFDYDALPSQSYTKSLLLVCYPTHMSCIVTCSCSINGRSSFLLSFCFFSLQCLHHVTESREDRRFQPCTISLMVRLQTSSKMCLCRYILE